MKNSNFIVYLIFIIICENLGSRTINSKELLHSGVPLDDLAVLQQESYFQSNKVRYRSHKQLTDSAFKRITPEMAGKIYEIIKITDEILTKHHIPYWAIGGTLLGVVRHKGLIPWDDDGDIMVMQHDLQKIITLTPEFEKLGIKVKPGNCFTKVFFNGDPVYPALDIFTGKRLGKKIISTCKPFAKKDFWSFSELFPLVRASFGPFKILIPHEQKRYLKFKYGADYMVSGVYWNHTGIRIKEKVKIIDRRPAEYVSVHSNIHLH